MRTKPNRISAHRIRPPAAPSWTSGLSELAGRPRALSFDVFYDADPPEVDYQPRIGRWWTTAALAVDDPRVAIQIEVIVAASADAPSGDLCDRITVTFDDTNSTEVEIRGKVVGKPVKAAMPGRAAVASGTSPAAPHRRRPPAFRDDPTLVRVVKSIIWPVFGLSCVAFALGLAFGYTIPTSELPNILWLQFIVIPLCAFLLAAAVFAVLPWSIVHAVRQWRPKTRRGRAPSRRGMPSPRYAGTARSRAAWRVDREFR